ncbi:MAG: hypothetical protein JO033_12910 [Acidobacteriaceae bacterium]|nr:hypothetical protein [Acidobacteriaceae bacterium]MBV9500309.1 hypothetical protein [Acidobacteriaceae bacterium]
MNWIRRLCRAIWELFIEDGSFALTILIWVTVTGFLLAKILRVQWRGPALLVGLLAILFENVRRTAKPPGSR